MQVSHKLRQTGSLPAKMKRFLGTAGRCLAQRIRQQHRALPLSRLEADLKDARKVLILRPDNIGDLLLFSGCLRFLRKATPAHLTLAVQPQGMGLLELSPHVDAVVSVHEVMPPAGRGGWWQRCRERLFPVPPRCRLPFDLIIYPVKSPQVHHLEALWRSGHRKIAGIAGCTLNAPGGLPRRLAPERLFAYAWDVSALEPWMHELELNYLFLKNLGSFVHNVREVRPTVWTTPDDAAFASSHLPAQRRLVGIFPGASDPRKCWAAEHYATVAAGVPGTGAFVIFGSAADVGGCSDVERLLRGCRPDWEVVNLCGKTSLRELYCCIASCTLLLCTDSAGLHIGITAGIATVAVAGGWHGRRFTGWGSPELNRVITKELPCRGCNWSCVHPTYECIQGVDPREVSRCVNELLTTVESPLVAGGRS